jgi:hypothetical protein
MIAIGGAEAFSYSERNGEKESNKLGLSCAKLRSS